MPRQSSSKPWLACGIILLVGGFSKACIKMESHRVSVPAILPITGPSADLGRSVANGMELAAEALEREYPRIDFHVSIEDSKGSPGEAVTALRALLAREQSPVVLSWMSSVGQALKPITTERGTALFVGAALSGITEPTGLVVRVWPNAEQLAQEMGSFGENHAAERFAVLYVNDDYGRSVAETFAKAIRSQGRDVVAMEPLDLGQTDFRILLARVRSREPQVIYMPAYGGLYVHGLRQLREVLGDNVEVWADLPLLSQFTLPNLGGEIEGVVVPATHLDLRPYGSKQARDFAEEYVARFGREPDFNSGLGYMMYWIAAEALVRGSRTGEDVAHFVSTRGQFDGPVGLIRYGDQNDCSISLRVARITNREPVPLEGSD